MSQQHARPHLQTHTRSAGHSAVAGAAYRLGLRLYDERARKWHDFRHRKIGEEIVRALTVAPPDAPAWATDPSQLWNRVEAAEKRKDAQVARDFRIPIPFGLTDQQAGDLAEEMSWFIAKALHTAVSMGLHRDGELDALGELKPPEKQGYHAHLFFPTRRLEQLEDADGKSDWGLGAKFVALSNKNSSGAFVERLNAQWAALCNKFTAANNLPADYTHLSYVRQGLPLEPRPKIGRGAVALERKGFFTERGDALRNHILVASKVYEAAQAVVLEVQKEQATADAIRERTNPAARATRLAAEASAPPQTAAAQPDESAAPPVIHAPVPKPPLTAAPGSLAARFHAAAPEPATLEDRQLFAQLMKIVGLIERALRAMAALADRFKHYAEDRERRMAAKLETDFQLDVSRKERTAAEHRLKQWESAHPWQVATVKALSRDGGKPRAWQALVDQVSACNRRVQSLKTAVRSHQAHLDIFAVEEVDLKKRQADAHERLRTATGSFVSLSALSVELFLSAAHADELELLKPEMPVTATPQEPSEIAPPSEAVARLRPSFH